ncbi:COX15 [Cordylochernes scorpioides]|uniref:COX15 n=1 Tax=Cordylochernes scorpioides TaxID=51811 RepID=A0ABY6K386_9ARAC|nr:COX15 [Cordylochernes scorpioides]
MVKSGLVEKEGPARVSQYRLTGHLGGAFVLYALCLWSGLAQLLPPEKMEVTKKMLTFRKMAHGTKGLIFLTALSERYRRFQLQHGAAGGLVAGIQAGLVYNTFPKMGSTWVPSDLLANSPTWTNFFENPTAVQFNHRVLAETTFVAAMGLWAYSRKLPLPPRARKAVNAVAAMACVQVGLGITTLLLYVDKALASIHQFGALAFLTAAIWLTHELKLVKILRRIPK